MQDNDHECKKRLRCERRSLKGEKCTAEEYGHNLIMNTDICIHAHTTEDDHLLPTTHSYPFWDYHIFPEEMC